MPPAALPPAAPKQTTANQAQKKTRATTQIKYFRDFAEFGENCAPG